MTGRFINTFTPEPRFRIATPVSIPLTSTPGVVPLELQRRVSVGPTMELGPEHLARNMLAELFDSSLVLAEDWARLSASVQESIGRSRSFDELLPNLVQHGLLTMHQSERIRAGTTYGLILGNYRVLDRIGAGGMGVVFRAEHILMRRIVAIKVLPLSRDQDTRLLLRFIAEMRAISALQHPNIVTAMDAGQVHPIEPNQPVLHYLVMECVDGIDLEEHVIRHGPMDPVMACDLIHQISCAIAEANARKMVHRDIKPSNIIVTGENQAKLLDFGLAHDFRSQLTEQGSVLGTLEYMAPEQAQDARSVDIRADIYGLGGTLFWCLTGQLPFPKKGMFIHDLARRMIDPPPSIRTYRPDLPAELDAVVARMMAPRLEDRFAQPQAVMRALMPFMRSERHESLGGSAASWSSETQSRFLRPSSPDFQLDEAKQRILLIDDDASVRQVCRAALQNEAVQCDEAVNGEEGLAQLAACDYDVVVLDMEMPRMSGPETLRAIRENPRHRNLRILMASGRFSPDEMSQMLLAGADDYLLKPFSVMQLRGRVQTSLRLKKALDESEMLNVHLQQVSTDLERALTDRDGDLLQVRHALVLGLASIVEHRTTETSGHLQRVQKYCRSLAEEATTLKMFDRQIDQAFIQNLECCAPLHDIGIVALPDHILMKPGKLDVDERMIMQAHTSIGSEILQRITQKYGASVNFLNVGIELTRSHHEHFSGGGYPDRLVGDQIPLSARILAIGDVYDALRSRRSYRPALSHNSAAQVICEGVQGQFDPDLLAVFQRSHASFEKIFQQFAD